MRSRSWTYIASGLVVVILVAAVAVPLFRSYYAKHDRVVRICGKESVSTKDNGHEYRVYTNSGTFKMTDTLLGGVRFNTADAYGRLAVDKTYTITYHGWRSGFSSDFPNIDKAVVVTNPDDQLPESVCS